MGAGGPSRGGATAGDQVGSDGRLDWALEEGSEDSRDVLEMKSTGGVSGKWRMRERKESRRLRALVVSQRQGHLQRPWRSLYEEKFSLGRVQVQTSERTR